jgi:PKD repeat protein
MITNRIPIIFIFLLLLAGLSGCKEETYSFGDIITPTDLSLTTVVTGTNTTNPNGNGTGSVAITASATNAITYKVDFGDGTYKMVSTGAITHKYTNPGTYNYTVTVNAVGTAGTTTTVSKKITVFVAFEIPAAILQSLTNNSSKTWILDKTKYGSLGMGPVGGFESIWWNLDPLNAADMAEKSPAFDDEVTFTKDVLNNVLMTVDNKGFTFMNGNCVSFYGATGSANGGYPLNTGGTKKLIFMDATSATTSAISTRIQFEVPGNGIIIFGVASHNYEILTLTNDVMYLHCVGGIDGFSWFQRLIPKP